MNNYAFIDAHNLKVSIKNQGWQLDFRKFRIYLRDKYAVSKAFLFLGYIHDKKSSYDALRRFGFELVFKPTCRLPDGSIKGNVDAELVLHTMIQYNHFDGALIVSNDGDFYCLVDYLKNNRKLHKLLIPDQYSYSSLLRPFRSDMVYMNNLRVKLLFKKSNTKTRGSNLRTKP